jgi:nucleoside-diphosphate-sugar epimerase
VIAFYKQLNNDCFYLIDNGEGACNTVFIDNLIDAIFLAIENHNAIGETFFVTDDEEINWRRFYSKWASFLKKDIRFNSINSAKLDGLEKGNHWSKEFKTFFGSATFRNFFLEIPKINRITKPFYKHFGNLHEDKKIVLKNFLNYYQPEKEISSKKISDFIRDMSRIERESGKTFTNIEKVKNVLGFKPRMQFESGSLITKEWLEFAGFLDN